jgi:cytochrome c oxidase assembly protein subunit 15
VRLPSVIRDQCRRVTAAVRLPPVTLDQYRRVTAAVLVSVGVIIVTGAAVRLTGSGLGCTEWPTCEQGRVLAPLETHALIEFGNRLITGLIAIPIGLAFAGSFLVRPRRRDLTWWSAGLIAGVAAQAVLGGISVKMELAPAFISAHFLLSIVLVWNALVLHHRAGTGTGPPVAVVEPATVRLSRAMVALAAAVLFSGTLVTGTGPHAGDERAHRYDFATITAVARFHSLLAWAFLAVALVVVWRVTRPGAPARLEAPGRRLVAAILLQGALGYAQYAAGVPAYLVIVHIAGAVLVFSAAMAFHFALFARPEGERAPTVAPALGPPAAPASGT